MKNCVFTIVAKNYIGLAQILEKSFRKTNPDCDFFIIVADELHDNLDALQLADNILIAKDNLNIESVQWNNMSFKYDLTEFCTSIKPSAFLFFFEKMNYDKIIYLDPDIYVFENFDFIFSELDSYSIILTPHLSKINENNIGDLPDSDFMATGTFNLGFCAIKADSISVRMLTWWRSKLLDNCYIDAYGHSFTDQKWMDFLPSFFSNTELLICRHLGMNLAPWNFFQRRVLKEHDKFMVTDRTFEDNQEIYPLLFVHFSGYNYKELLTGNVVQNNISKIKDYPDIELITTYYSNAIKLEKSVFEKFIRQNYTYNFFTNGDQIKSIHRRLYRSLVDKGEVIVNPFNTGLKTYHNKLLKLGMTKSFKLNVDKASKINLNGIESKLKIINMSTRLFYKIIGFERYVLFIRLLRPYSRFESQIHLINKLYDKNNIS